MSSPRPVSPRTRVVALVVVVALVALSAATLLGILLSGGAGDSGPGSGPDPSAPDAAQPELTLVLPGATEGRCAAFSVDVLRGVEQAFAGTAVAVEDRDVILRVEHWYRGGDAQVVRLTAGDDVGRGLVEGLTFTEGQQYLVSADAGAVTPCGYSAAWSPGMARAFAAAFES